MTLKQATKRIEELERRVKELEARPVIQPFYVPYYQPVYPHPTYTPTPYLPLWPTITCGDGGNVGIAQPLSFCTSGTS